MRALTDSEILRLAHVVLDERHLFIDKVLDFLTHRSKVIRVAPPYIIGGESFSFYNNISPLVSITEWRFDDLAREAMEKDIEGIRGALRWLVGEIAHEFRHYEEHRERGDESFRAKTMEEFMIEYEERPNEIAAAGLGDYIADAFYRSLEGEETVVTPLVEDLARQTGIIGRQK